MPPKYLTTCAELPANKPAGHPHLLDCSDITALQDFTFADAMATILYNWKPEALRAFLDLSKDEFVFKIEQAVGSTKVDFVIGRTGNIVVVSVLSTPSRLSHLPITSLAHFTLPPLAPTTI